mmetsp:Transcript_23665/g.23378  ORF Transcript_23665/g.23378 Transcript_23665/m.23378 type:complete len:112 (+) Transcript_23665:122-457(+)
MEKIWESFKVRLMLDDNPDNLGDRLINLTQFSNTKTEKDVKTLTDLLYQAKKEEKDKLVRQERGLVPVNKEFMASMAYQKKSIWGEVWKYARMRDIEKKGLIKADELEEIL